MAQNNKPSKTFDDLALTYIRSLVRDSALRHAWKESKEKTVEDMKEHGIVDVDEVGTLLRSYHTLATSLANSLLINLENAKLIVVSPENRDDAISMLTTSPTIVGSIRFALAEVAMAAKDNILGKEKNDG